MTLVEKYLAFQKETGTILNGNVNYFSNNAIFNVERRNEGKKIIGSLTKRREYLFSREKICR